MYSWGTCSEMQGAVTALRERDLKKKTLDSQRRKLPVVTYLSITECIRLTLVWCPTDPSSTQGCTKTNVVFYFLILSPLFSQFGSQSHPYFFNYPPPPPPPPCYSWIHRISTAPSLAARGAFCMRASKLLSPPPSPLE